MFSSKETSKMGKNAKDQHNQVAWARAGRKQNSTCNPINATILKKIKDIQSKVHAGGLGTKEIRGQARKNSVNILQKAELIFENKGKLLYPLLNDLVVSLRELSKSNYEGSQWFNPQLIPSLLPPSQINAKTPNQILVESGSLISAFIIQSLSVPSSVSLLSPKWELMTLQNMAAPSSPPAGNHVIATLQILLYHFNIPITYDPTPLF